MSGNELVCVWGGESQLTLLPPPLSVLNVLLISKKASHIGAGTIRCKRVLGVMGARMHSVRPGLRDIKEVDFQGSRTEKVCKKKEDAFF